MIKKYSLLLIMILCFVLSGFGQVTTIDFETAGAGYSPSTTFGGGLTDVFNRTNPNLGGNNSYMWSVEDLTVTNPYIDIDQIDVSSSTSFTFSIDMIAHHFNDWDDSDELLITYSLDGGPYQNLMWVQNAGGTFNQAASLDADFDGDGDCGTGILPALTIGNSGCNVISATFETFSTTSIVLSGNSTLDINLQFNGLDADDEGIYLDNIIIDVVGGSPTPTITTTPSSLTGLDYSLGSGPSVAQSYQVSGTSLTPANGSITVTAPANFSISKTVGGTYTNSLTYAYTGGTLPASNVFVRLNAGLPVGTYGPVNITNSGGGATSQSVSLDGTVTSTSGDCASESFTNAGDFGSYNTRNWTGDNGIDWTATDSRSDQDLNGNEAIMLRVGSLTNNTSFPGGCGVITFDYARIFTNNSTLKVFINGTQYGGDITVSQTTSTTFSTTVNETGFIDVELRNSGNRTLINNLSWTCHACSAPSDASSFAATNGCGGIELNWDAPACAEEVLIVARDGSAVSAMPSGDGSAYTDNTVFGSGTALLAGQFDVYEGNGTSTTITGLTNGNTYHFTVFSRVGNTWSTGISASATFSSASPNVTTFSTYNNCGDIQLNWTLPSCYDDVLVVARQGNAVTATPTGDGSAYTGNPVFGSGTALSAGQFVVYQGNGTTEIITGLTSGNTYHFEIFTRVGTTWSTGVSASAIAITSGGSGPTTFNPGDLVFVGFDSYIGGANDKYSILNLVDIGPNTEFIIANLLYEWNDAASASSGKWYDCDNQFDQDPSYALIEYVGCSDIPKGSVICVETSGIGNILYITINGITATSEFNIDTTNYTAGNISTSNPDAMWLMQGAFSAVQTEADGTDNGTALDKYRTFTGTVFGGLQTKGNFQDVSVAGNSGGLRVSRLHPDIECLYLETGPTSNNKFFGFYFGFTTGSQYALLSNITDISNFWDIQSGTGGVQDSDNISFTCSDVFTVTGNDANAGQWMGNISTDWFDCHNWQNFTVPDNTVDVNINSTSTRNCNIDYTSTFAPKYNFVADCNNLNLLNRSLIIDSNGDVLNVYGDLLIDVAGTLDMDDGNAGTVDGELYLHGNWTNKIGPNAFAEGNGTVIITGTTPQTVNVSIPLPPSTSPTEEFYNVILNNDFSTSISNDLYMNGSLTVNSGRTVEVAADDYVHIHNNLTNNGTFNILNNGSLVQVNDAGVNTGNINMERKASVDNLDYVYWSSPVQDFTVGNISSTSYIYKWNPTFGNINGTLGNWESAIGDTMLKGVGYIVRGSNGQAAPVVPGDLNFTVNFVQVPFNGLTQVPVSRGNIAGTDDQWNLVGNPYPSAVDVFAFLDHGANNVLDGFVNFWTHGNDPSPLVVDPFYYDFGSNYTASDYIAYNASGAGNGPGNISIASGQSFMVNLLDTAPANTVIEFNNSMRNRDYVNSQFYRTTQTNYNNAERHRIWLDLVSETQGTNRILVGYVEGATMERDRMYDAITTVSTTQQLYSLIDNETFVIQGRGLPFNETDVIPLGVNIATQGNYYLAIAYIDGLFETENQTIYLKDKLLSLIHNLNESPYSFTSEVGEFNDRFELVFRDSFLSVNEEELLANQVTIIEHQNGEVQFTVPNQFEIKSIEIIDLLGRTIYKLKGNSHSETYNLSNLSQSTYIAKITLADGQVISKKAVKRK